MKPLSVALRPRLITSQEQNENTANNVALAGTFPSRWDIGSVVSFQPDVRRLDDERDMAFGGTKSKVASVTFDAGKVLYELYVYDGEDGWYTNYPIRNVDSYFVRPWPIEEEL